MSEPRPVAVLGPSGDWPRGVRALTTTRIGGVGRGPWATLGLAAGGGDEAAVVQANRQRLQRGLALPSAPTWLRQVHGTAVVGLDGWSDVGHTPVADAVWTARAGPVCAVLSADCLPVVLAARSGAAVAVAHAGWRGLAAGVIEAAIAALPAEAGELQAWLGPAIGPRAFEVGPEVRAAFVEQDAGQTEAFRRSSGQGSDRWYGDLYALARRRLHASGVVRVSGGGWCTYGERERFFSHRRDAGRTGRMATLAWLESPGLA